MRFLPNGPSIPDDLLVARDAGDVVFFCGAGVSRHRAGLPDFLTLGEKVIDLLRAGQKSLARRLFERIQALGSMKGVGGLVATDRIFSILEREFDPKLVRAAVAQAIKPEDTADLSAHQILVDLSRGRDGTIRLVTTNFDLLFERCVDGISSHGPPMLPTPRSATFRGIVHLHGRVKPDSSAPGDEEFIISSADFGRAYMADGWATQFIRSLLARFQVVFVGYAADDPPMQYLLEALNLRAGNRSRLFAFQEGSNADEAALWEHRGVRAIPFDNSGGFAPLWDTLGAWAERARDPDVWYSKLLKCAEGGPAGLDPYIRGQVAHLFSTQEGAKRISRAATPIPASWLLVLDALQRFDSPGRSDPYSEASDRIDPYDSLALDFDTPPQPEEHDDNPLHNRKIPEGSWDGFGLTFLDNEEGQAGAFGAFHGPHATLSAELSARLRSFGIWFNRIAHQPIALWWAAGRGPLHRDITGMIEGSLHTQRESWREDIRDGWRSLIACWSARDANVNRAFFDLAHRIQNEGGWSEARVREYADLFCPRLEVERRHGIRHPLSWTETDRPQQLLSLQVQYPRPYELLAIPDAHLAYAISRFRENLDLARSLIVEIYGGGYVYMQTTRSDDGEQPVAYDAFGVTGPLAMLQQLMERLFSLSPHAARAEIARWPTNDNLIFGRLRIWAASSEATKPAEAANILLSFPNEIFWGPLHQRDLLYAIRDRWSHFSGKDRLRIERRLRTSSFPWSNMSPNDKRYAKAHRRLDRLYWLRSNGVAFSFDVDAEIAMLQRIASRWDERSGESAADSNAPVVRSVETDTNWGTLAAGPVATILDRANRAGRVDFFDLVERHPFTGLSEGRPVRALAALRHAARANDAPVPYWSAFLYAESRKTDRPRMVRAIIAQLMSLGTGALGTIAYPIAEWLTRLGDRVYHDLAPIIDCVWSPLMEALAGREDNRTRRIDSSWANDALNAPVGVLSSLLMKDPSLGGLRNGQGFPAEWTGKLEQLLALPGDMRRHALVMLGFQIVWLFSISPAWTIANLLSVVDHDDEDSDALWDGILWAARPPTRLLFERLKPSLLRRSASLSRRSAESNVIAAYLLIGWVATLMWRSLNSSYRVQNSVISLRIAMVICAVKCCGTYRNGQLTPRGSGALNWCRS